MAKSAQAFRTIREVADWLGVAAHVLRFWESKFSQIKPVKRAGGRRYYRPSDMEIVGGIKVLLHDRGMTIRGVKKMISDEGLDAVTALSPPLDALSDDDSVFDVTPDQQWELDAASEDSAPVEVRAPLAADDAREAATDATAASPISHEDTAAQADQTDASVMPDAEEPEEASSPEEHEDTRDLPQDALSAPEQTTDIPPLQVERANAEAAKDGEAPVAASVSSPTTLPQSGAALDQLARLAGSGEVLRTHLPALKALRDRMTDATQTQ